MQVAAESQCFLNGPQLCFVQCMFDNYNLAFKVPCQFGFVTTRHTLNNCKRPKKTDRRQTFERQTFERPLAVGRWVGSSVARLGNFLHFGQLFKVFGNNSFAQISHIVRQFL